MDTFLASHLGGCWESVKEGEIGGEVINTFKVVSFKVCNPQGSADKT